MRPIGKPTLPLFLLLGLTISFVVRSARAEKEEWKNIGPYTGVIRAIAIDPLHPDVIYAGTDDAGLFKTTDGGARWITANDGLGVHNAIEVYALAIDQKDSGVILAGTGDGLFRSKNHGFTWTAVKRTRAGVQALAIDRSNGNVIYAGLNASFGGTNILKSTDRGATWTDLVRVPKTDPVFTIAIDPANPKTIYAGGDRAIAKSVDGGANWISCVSGLTLLESPNSSVFEIAIDPSKPSTVYAATVRGVFKSVDGGATWTGINHGLPAPFVTAIAIDRFNTGAVFAGVSQKGLYRSTNGGANWEANSTGLSGTTILAIGLCPSNKNLVCVGTRRDGVFKSGDGGPRWSAVNAGLHAAYITTVAMDRSNSGVIYAGGYRDQRIFKTTNSGGSWTSVDTESVSGISINPTNTSTVYAATFRGIFSSEDAGASWTDISSGLPSRFARAVAVDPSNPMTIFAGIADGTIKSPFNGVFKSTNGGVSWRFVSSEFEGSCAEVLAIAPSNTKIIYAGGLPALYKSTDGGASWAKVYSNRNQGRVTAIAIDASDAKTIFVGNERGLLKTTDGGAEWTQIRITPSDNGIASIAIDPVVSSIVYVGTSQTVFRSADGGKAWSWVSEGLPVIRVTALVIDPSDHETVYAATAGASIFKRRFKTPNQSKPVQNTRLETAPPSSPNNSDITQNPAVDTPPVPLNRPRLGGLAGAIPPGSVDTPPVPLNYSRPHYTEEARKNKTEGRVRLRILVGADGSVKKLEVIEGLPDGLTEAAMSAGSKLKFKPAMKDGQPVPYWMPIIVEFYVR